MNYRNHYGSARSVHTTIESGVHKRVRRVAKHGSMSAYYSLSAEVTLELLSKADPDYKRLAGLIRRFNGVAVERVVERLERTIEELRDGMPPLP